MRILRVHHLTLGVNNVDAAAATFDKLFGATARERANIPAFGTRIVNIPLGEDTLELASPISPDNPLARFLQRKGEGFYNVALEVDDLDAAVSELRDKGARVSDPVEAQPGIRSAFIAMSATHGLSVQLVEDVRPQPEPAPASEPELAPTPDPKEWAPPPDEAPEPELPPSPAAPAPPLDLTPDEWSDVD